MTPNFKQCEQCGIIFHNPEGRHSLCPRCRDEAPAPATKRDVLRTLKSLIRDAMTRGELLTVPDLAESADVSEEQIWRYIRDGEIDTASFDDPEVRSFLLKRQVERERELRRRFGQPQRAKAKDEDNDKEYGGFHHRGADERRK